MERIAEPRGYKIVLTAQECERLERLLKREREEEEATEPPPSADPAPSGPEA